MFRCYSYTIIRERISLFLLKLQLLKQSTAEQYNNKDLTYAATLPPY